MKKGIFLDGVKADSFRIAIHKLQSKGIKETYRYFKSMRDKHSNSHSKLGRNLANAYNLVLGKLWKRYKKANQKHNI